MPSHKSFRYTVKALSILLLKKKRRRNAYEIHTGVQALRSAHFRMCLETCSFVQPKHWLHKLIGAKIWVTSKKSSTPSRCSQLLVVSCVAHKVKNRDIPHKSIPPPAMPVPSLCLQYESLDGDGTHTRAWKRNH